MMSSTCKRCPHGREAVTGAAIRRTKIKDDNLCIVLDCDMMKVSNFKLPLLLS